MTARTAGTDRLEPHPAHYLIALAAYVALAMVFKMGVLNWIVGPLFLVAALEIVPRALGAARRSERGSNR